MKISWKVLVPAALFFGRSLAFPSGELEKRSILSSVEDIAKSVLLEGKSDANGTKSRISEIMELFSSGKVRLELKYLSKVEKSIKNMINSVIPAKEFHSIQEVKSFVESIFSNTNGTLINNVVEMIASGISSESILDIHQFSDEFTRTNYSNTHEPKTAVYPKANSKDAPYTFSEDELRSAIGIPSDFEYGKGTKKPVLLVPGTASMGGLVYHSNYAKLLKDTDFADIVWLNVPGFLLDDCQNNVEFIAYAVNYLSGITNKNVSIISWSQGGAILQWAFKYWPSTISKVDNFIPLAPDFKGTDMAYIACPAFGYDKTCTPSIKQQVTDSNFIQKLLEDDGDSAYVPTTSVYSGFDDLVSNEFGTNASSYVDLVSGC